MIFRQVLVCVFVIAIQAAASSKDFHDFGDYDPDTMILHEEYFPFTDEEADDEHHFLRRSLQTTATVQPVCSATAPRTQYVCGGAAGGASNPCYGSTASCSSLPRYSCSCSGSLSSESSCTYCQIQTANAISCHVSNSVATFVAPNFTIQTCSCMYIGNGQVRQSCWTPTPQPIPLPSWPPGDVRASLGGSAPAAVPAVVPTPVFTPVAPPPTQRPVIPPSIPAAAVAPSPTRRPATATNNKNKVKQGDDDRKLRAVESTYSKKLHRESKVVE